MWELILVNLVIWFFWFFLFESIAAKCKGAYTAATRLRAHRLAWNLW